MSHLSQLNRFFGAFALATFASSLAVAQGVVNVTVDANKPLNTLTSTLVGAWTNMGDGDLTDPKGDATIRAAGITAVTYPTGWEDIADIYHWSANKVTPNAGDGDAIRKPYLQGKNDFASVAVALSKVGIKPVVHVNYGSNLAGTGGGEPKEAAAWVAYANGSANDTREIGKDSTGTDWKTVGYWAAMRGEDPLNADDGYNFLRVSHPEPFQIELWQVGEDVSENGYYGANHTYALDLHAPYPAAKKDEGKRKKLTQLSPRTYAEQLTAYSAAMKAVDPAIQVGATLTLPVASLQDPSSGYAPDWNPTILKTACKDIDFVSYIWNPGNSSNDEQWKNMDDGILLGSLTDDLPRILQESIHEDRTACPGGKILHIAFSQFSPLAWPKIQHPNVVALFIADAYASLAEDGITNADWFQLRDGGLFDNGKPTPAYYGAQMAHIVAYRPGATYLGASNPKTSLDVHATKRQDGFIGVMLLNRDLHDAKTVRLNIAGAGDLAPQAIEFDYGPAQQAAGTGPVRATANVDGASLTVNVPAYGIVDILLKKK
jgi:alpha-L-arabinofuranosidase